KMAIQLISVEILITHLLSKHLFLNIYQSIIILISMYPIKRIHIFGQVHIQLEIWSWNGKYNIVVSLLTRVPRNRIIDD
ncbi:hypothetical protein ACJX0J_008496, partial [Zea mays]